MKRTLLALVAVTTAAGIAHAQGPKEKSPGERSPHRIEKFIEAADQNGDKAVSADEYAAFIKKQTDERFDKLDTNKDGNISREEFSVVDKRSDRFFEHLDTNKDGKIDVADKPAKGEKFKDRAGKPKPPHEPRDLGAEGKPEAKP